jgi:hypothetical protein
VEKVREWGEVGKWGQVGAKGGAWGAGKAEEVQAVKVG